MQWHEDREFTASSWYTVSDYSHAIPQTPTHPQHQATLHGVALA
jgi:hypothetical protein